MTATKPIKFNTKRLDELKSKSLSHATSETFGVKLKEGVTADQIAEATEKLAVINKYLHRFVEEGNECICCGAKQGVKDIMEAVLHVGAFTWDIQHGEGHCSQCGYPARAMHYIGDGLLTVRNFILQYHPDGLSFE